MSTILNFSFTPTAVPRAFFLQLSAQSNHQAGSNTFGAGMHGFDHDSIQQQNANILAEHEARTEFSQSYGVMIATHVAMIACQQVVKLNRLSDVSIQIDLAYDASQQVTRGNCKIVLAAGAPKIDIAIESDLISCTNSDREDTELEKQKSMQTGTAHGSETTFQYNGIGSMTQQVSLCKAAQLQHLYSGFKSTFLENYKLCQKQLCNTDSHGLGAGFFPFNDVPSIRFENTTELASTGKLEFFQNTEAADKSFTCYTAAEKQRQAVRLLEQAALTAELHQPIIKKNLKSKTVWIQDIADQATARRLEQTVQRALNTVDTQFLFEQKQVEGDTAKKYCVKIGYDPIRISQLSTATQENPAPGVTPHFVLRQ